ncbi:MAG: YARHG domain-containing protein [Bacillota bacterium]
MLKRIAVLLALLVLLTAQGGALASNFYIVPDSGSRRLTQAELWEWQYDALGYILNEIFARHGFPFDPAGKYYPYFFNQSWYKEDASFTYDWLNDTEWHNERLVKDVRAEMRRTENYNLNGKAVPGIEQPMHNIPWGFTEYPFSPGQKLNVYSGPGTNYVRGANGKASVSTNGSVYVFGWENGWLMILYRLNNGGGRIGYVNGSQLIDSVQTANLSFSYQPTEVLRNCSITDDPMVSAAPLATLPSGTNVTFLCWMQNNTGWAYVEANTADGLMRGCIPADSIALADD